MNRVVRSVIGVLSPSPLLAAAITVAITIVAVVVIVTSMTDEDAISRSSPPAITGNPGIAASSLACCRPAVCVECRALCLLPIPTYRLM